MSKHNKTIGQLAKELAVASPQATRPERICGNCGLPLVQGETEEMCRELDKVAARLEANRAAQPAAGTTLPPLYKIERGVDGGPVAIFTTSSSSSEATTPQAERPADTVRFRERLKKLSFLITGNDYAFLSENPEIEESLKVYVENVTEARAVAPVETPPTSSGHGSETLPGSRATDDGVAVQYRESPDSNSARPTARQWLIEGGGGFEDGEEWMGRAAIAETKLEAAEAEAAALRERERWIPVEEKLPPEGEHVLVVEDGRVAINYIPYANSVPPGSRNRWMSGHDYVTHWKALSAAPERPTDGKS